MRCHGGPLKVEGLSTCPQLATLNSPAARCNPVQSGLVWPGSLDAAAQLSGGRSPHVVVSERAALFTPTHSLCECEKLKAIDANCTDKSTRSVYANPPLIPIHSSLFPSFCSVSYFVFALRLRLLNVPCFSRHHSFIRTSPL